MFNVFRTSTWVVSLTLSLSLLPAATQATTISLGSTTATVAELTGEATLDGTGMSVSSAGDVNNDGYDDVLVGAYNNNDTGADAGAAYLIYGQATALTSASLSTAVEFTGEAAGNKAGYSVNTAGDVNNDGYDDVLVGAPYNNDGGFQAGAAYLIYGQAAALTSASLSTAVEFTGEAVGDLAGYPARLAGDVNNDGYDDFLVGAYSNNDAGADAGAAYLIYGRSAALTSASLSTAVELTGEAAGDGAGISVSSAGDVNNDGYDDILVGAYLNDDAAVDAGAGYLIYGQAGALTSASLSTAVEFTGEAADDNAGYSVSSGGDVNNDGYDDILVGAYANNDTGADAGAAYLIYGQAAALTSASLSTAVEFTGEAAGDRAAIATSSAGDVNNDGYDDILVGAYLNNDAAVDAGAAYLFYAQPSTITITDDTSPVNTVECGTGTFTDPGATATDQYTGSSLTVSTTSTVANIPTGTTTVTYSTASNALHIVDTATRTVTVSDTVAPVLTLVGDAAVSVQQDSLYTDDGVLVTEACDSTLLAATTTGAVDTAIPGNYTLTYSATDASGHVATTVTRTVTVTAHGAIVDVTKNGGSITLTYADGYTDTVEPFSGSKQFVFALSADQLGVVVTNGKLVRVFLDGVKIDQQKINKKSLKSKFITLKVKKLYAAKSYTDVIVMIAKKTTGKVNHIRLTSVNLLTKFKHKQVDIAARTPGAITTKASLHRFITTFGQGANKTKSTWKVTAKGKLKQLQ